MFSIRTASSVVRSGRTKLQKSVVARDRKGEVRAPQADMTLFAAFSYLVEAANQRHQGEREFLVTRRYTPLIELLIVSESHHRAGLSEEPMMSCVKTVGFLGHEHPSNQR